MPIITVSYSKKFTIGPYLTESIGAEISLGEDQDPMEALESIHKLADEFHKKANPHLYEQARANGYDDYDDIFTEKLMQMPDLTPEDEPEIQAETIPKKQADMIASIMGGTTYNEVKLYEKLAAKYPAVLEAYNEKLKQFENGTTN